MNELCIGNFCNFAEFLETILMDCKEIYTISLRDLSLVTHEYHFQLEDEFFERIEAPEVKRGSVMVNLSIRKSAQSFNLLFHLEGFVFVPCNRCLEDMKQSIDAEGELMVKFGDEFEEVDDTLIVVPECPGEIDLSWYMYEFIALNIPIRHVHPDGECSETMAAQLSQYLAVERTDEDENVSDDSDDSEIEKEVDPRWEGLRKLLDKK